MRPLVYRGCYKALVLLLDGSEFGIQSSGLVWNFTEVKQDKGFWTLASVRTLHLASVVVQVFGTYVWGCEGDTETRPLIYRDSLRQGQAKQR